MVKGVVGDLALRNGFDIVLYCNQTVECRDRVKNGSLSWVTSVLLQTETEF